MNGKDPKPQTSAQRRAVNFFALRAAVALYLIYLGFDLFRSYLVGASTLSPTAAWLCGPGFMAAGLLFALYSWRRYRREIAAAAEESAETPAGEESPEGKE